MAATVADPSHTFALEGDGGRTASNGGPATDCMTNAGHFAAVDIDTGRAADDGARAVLGAFVTMAD